VYHFKLVDEQRTELASWTLDLKNSPGFMKKGVHGKIDATFILKDDDFV